MSILLFAGSLVLTVIFLIAGFPFFFFFLFIPIIPFMKKEKVLTCPVCGWSTSGPELFCPFDGTKLTPQPGRD